MGPAIAVLANGEIDGRAPVIERSRGHRTEPRSSSGVPVIEQSRGHRAEPRSSSGVAVIERSRDDRRESRLRTVISAARI